MTEVSFTTGAPASGVSRTGAASKRAASADTTTTTQGRETDQVELSTMARFMSKLKELPDVRQDLIEQTRREIELGRYDTPERFDTALDHMIEDAGEAF